MADRKSHSKILRRRNGSNELHLYKMFDRLSYRINSSEIKLLALLSGTHVDAYMMKRIVTSKDFFHVLSTQGNCDQTNVHNIIEILKLVKHFDLVHLAQVRRKIEVSLDPVEEYLKNISQIPHNVDPVANSSNYNQTLRLKISEAASPDDRISFPGSMSSPWKRLRRSQRISTRSFAKNEPIVENSLPGLRKKYTCDVRLRVRAEYCNYQSVLQGNVSSIKPDPVERQLECFTQASAILRTRDLGFIVCDMKFSEITYLDAFWRDYLNGSLLEALKGVFITDSLKQAVGNNAVKLLVNVEESDYEKGRSILMNNLHQSL